MKAMGMNEQANLLSQLKVQISNLKNLQLRSFKM